MNVVAISDREKYITYLPSKTFSLSIKEELPISLQGVATQCLKAGKTNRTDLSKELWGTAIKVLAVPIIEANNEIVGSFNVVTNMTDSLKLLDIINSLAETTEQLSASVEELAASAGDLASSGQKEIELTQEISQKAQETDQVPKLYKEYC